MAVGYHLNEHPSDYGLPDWWHDPDGRVNYSWDADFSKQFYDPDNPTDFAELARQQDITYKEECTEEALDNMSWERNHRSARIDGFNEWERNQELYN